MHSKHFSRMPTKYSRRLRNLQLTALSLLFVSVLVVLFLSRVPAQVSEKLLPLASLVKIDNHYYHIPDNSSTPSLAASLRYNETYRLFTSDGRFILWTFWDKLYTAPNYIRASLDAMRCHSRAQNQPKLILLTLENLGDFIGVHKSFPYLKPAHQADYVRCAVLLRYGGLYMDLDTIQLLPLRSLFHSLQTHEIYGYNWPPEKAGIGVSVIGPARSNLSLFSRWKVIADGLLDDSYNKLLLHAQHSDLQPYPIKWTALLTDILQPVLEDLLKTISIHYKQVHGPTTFGRLRTLHYDKLLFRAVSERDFENVWRSLGVGSLPEFLVYHQTLLVDEKEAMRSMSAGEFLQSDVLLARLLRKSFELCSV